ncbi:hypothetical protein AB0M54_12775 [Actinoplanes sp. NPDC051470]|uniref:hypothetical protein n=1 Tax=Actinoplanes sp. NPDC051470 TaxID=3157224 RepID=UPI003439EBDA
MSTRSVSFLVLGGALIAALTACTSPTESTGAAQPVGTPPAASTSSATVTPSPTAPGGKPGGRAAAANCPVTATTLLAAIKKEHPGWGASELSKIRCYQDYAMSTRRAADPNADTEVETFRYTGGEWHMFVGGSGGYCEGVPADVKKHFRGDGYPGCE